MQLTEEQIFALAPDDASKKAGKDLANPAKWVSKGINEKALWGECQGSGSKPYQTQVDLQNIAFKCSCPSRKFPCKHGLGLLLLQARQPGLFNVSDAPLWVEDWISKRAVKEEKQVVKSEKPVDENAQAKRQQAREQKVNDGIQELLLWLKDIIRNGILNIPEKGTSYWENMARRMVDNQSSGLAGRIKTLGATRFWEEGWQTNFMNQLLQLYLIANGYQNRENLPPDLQQDIKTAVGFNINQEILKEMPGVNDTWLVLAKESRIEEKLTIERNWLYGTQNNKYALILQFFVAGQSGAISLTPGMQLQAELVFIPSTVPLRAIIKNQQSTVSDKPPAINPFSGWQQLAEFESRLSSSLPFRGEQPYIVKNLKPVQFNKQWWLQDEQEHLVPLNHGFRKIWKILALGGGEALTMAVIGRENKFEPIGVWRRETYSAI